MQNAVEYDSDRETMSLFMPSSDDRPLDIENFLSPKQQQRPNLLGTETAKMCIQPLKTTDEKCVCRAGPGA